jgi:ABC-type polysaccharide transport system permease subunit
MAGNVIAFQKFLPMQGIWGSPWVGYEHFEDLFTDPVFMRVLRNTVWIAFLKLLIAFTTAAGLFNGVVGMILVLLADRLAKRMDLPGIF